MSTPQRVLIVGGGIAGLALAVALGRRGIVADIVEVKREWSVHGVGIIVQSNGIRALDAIGLADRAVAAGYPYSVSRQCDMQGVPLHDMPKPRVSADRFPSSCGMTRRALHELLRDEAVSLGVRVRLGTTVEALRETADAVTVTFTDGTSGDYDLVVGADGVHSAMRRRLFGERWNPRYSGQSCWRIALPRHPDVQCVHQYNGDGRTAILIPLSGERMYLALLTEEPGNPWMPPDRLHVLLRERLEGFGGLIPAIRATLDSPHAIVYSPLEPVSVPPPWSRGRVVLVGDAVHAPTPHLAQGASMAFEDAVVLTEILCDQDGTIEEKLLRFAERRHPRCRLIVESSVAMGEAQMQRRPLGHLVEHGLAALEALRAPI